MDDKFFDTARDRFEFHRRNVERELAFLEYMDYDYTGKLSPRFVEQVAAIKAALAKMAEDVDTLRKG